MNKVEKYAYMFLVSIVAVISLLIVFTLKQIDSQESIKIKDNKITIMYNTYTADDITKIELLDKINLSEGLGAHTSNTIKGRYKVNGDKFKSKVYIHKNINLFIRLTTKNSVIIFNEDNSDNTKSIYYKLVELAKKS